MRRLQVTLVTMLVLLFLVLSFNAYACVLPIVELPTATMGNGCSTPDEPPVRQFCDAFKTLSVESAVELHPTFDSHAISFEDPASLASVLLVAVRVHGGWEHPPSPPSHELLLQISVLRI